MSLSAVDSIISFIEMEVSNDKKIGKKLKRFSNCKIDYVIFAIIEFWNFDDQNASKHHLKKVNFAKNAKCQSGSKKVFSMYSVHVLRELRESF